MDNNNDGWHGAFITINGVNYCEDLVGNEKIVYIEANPSKYVDVWFLIFFIHMNIKPFIFVKSLLFTKTYILIYSALNKCTETYLWLMRNPFFESITVGIL